MNLYGLNIEQQEWFDQHREEISILLEDEATVQQVRDIDNSPEFKALFGDLSIDEALDLYDFPDSFVV